MQGQVDVASKPDLFEGFLRRGFLGGGRWGESGDSRAEWQIHRVILLQSRIHKSDGQAVRRSGRHYFHRCQVIAYERFSDCIPVFHQHFQGGGQRLIQGLEANHLGRLTPDE